MAQNLQQPPLDINLENGMKPSYNSHSIMQMAARYSNSNNPLVARAFVIQLWPTTTTKHTYPAALKGSVLFAGRFMAAEKSRPFFATGPPPRCSK